VASIVWTCVVEIVDHCPSATRLQFYSYEMGKNFKFEHRTDFFLVNFIDMNLIKCRESRLDDSLQKTSLFSQISSSDDAMSIAR
jgi:hypothetical protein